MKAVFFDLDDTLYDRSLPFVKAVEDLCPKQLAQVRRLNEACHRRAMERFYESQRGELPMRDFYIWQYQKGFGDCSVVLSDEEALAFRACYAQHQKDIALTETMREILLFCGKRARVGIITNGRSDHQREKLQSMGLAQYLDPSLIFVSGDFGIDKPDPRIFRMVQETCGCETSELLYIGDSYTTDIQPAALLGWHTLWLNRGGAVPPVGEPLPDGESATETGLLAQLQTLCGVNTE